MRFGIIASSAVLTLGLAAAQPLSAQNPTVPTTPPSANAPRGPGRLQAMALEGITLTPAQQTKVDSIGAAARAKMPPMTPGTPPSDADRAKMRGISMASLQDVRKVLTPDQQAVFDKNMAGIQQRMQQMQGAGGPPAGAPPAGTPPKP